jgi:hypothetical protein
VRSLPQADFRGKPLTFDEFSDLTIIGMAGLTDYLMKSPISPHADGMVNYRLVADGLGLLYEPAWLDQFSYHLENGIEAIASHDSAPEGHIDDGNWVYLNSGFTRIASLLYEKYYVPESLLELSFEEFSDVLLFELAGMVQDGIAEDGLAAGPGEPLSYDLEAVASHLDLPFEVGWIVRIAENWKAQGFIEAQLDAGQPERYRLTFTGYEHAQTLSDTIGAADGLLLSNGKGKLFFSVDASHISKLGLELVARAAGIQTNPYPAAVK